MTTAKYPASLLAIADLGGEVADAAAPTELTLDGAITASGTAILCNETIPAEYPASGWIRIGDEVIHYSSFTSKTFTADIRGDQAEYGAAAAAAHSGGATVGLWVTAQWFNQLAQDLIAVERDLLNGMSQTLKSDTDNTDDLGTSTRRWRDGYFGRSLQVGPAPAITGGARFSNDDTISWRNVANTADIAALRVDTGNNIIMNAGGQIVLQSAGTTVADFIGAVRAVQFDGSGTVGQTRMLLWDNDNAALERVTVGAADSGGAGFKVLRIPN